MTRILEFSLVFRPFLSQWINRDHEMMNTAVGAFCPRALPRRIALIARS